MLKIKRKTEKEKKNPSTGEKIKKIPELEKLIVMLVVEGKSKYAITKIVNKLGYKVTRNTLTEYINNIDENKKKEVEEEMMNVKKVGEKLISNTKDTNIFLSELMDELNRKTATLARSLDRFPDSKDAIALVTMSKFMVEVQQIIANLDKNIINIKKEVVDDVFYRVSELFFETLLPLIPPLKRIEVTSKLKNDLEKISEELLK